MPENPKGEEGSKFEELNLSTLHIRKTEFSREVVNILVKETTSEIAKNLGEALEEKKGLVR